MIFNKVKEFLSNCLSAEECDTYQAFRTFLIPIRLQSEFLEWFRREFIGSGGKSIALTTVENDESESSSDGDASSTSNSTDADLDTDLEQDLDDQDEVIDLSLNDANINSSLLYFDDQDESF